MSRPSCSSRAFAGLWAGCGGSVVTPQVSQLWTTRLVLRELRHD
jgi:hypothetical protein